MERVSSRSLRRRLHQYSSGKDIAMLTRVELQGDDPLYLDLLGATPRDSFILEKVEGLDPMDIDLQIGDRAGNGGYYTGRRVPPRTIEMQIHLNPNNAEGETVAQLRQRLYRRFMNPIGGDNRVRLAFTDSLHANKLITSGYTEKFESEIFSEEPWVLASIRCPDPFIHDSDYTDFVSMGATYPFEYTGSAPTGFSILMTITTATNRLVLEVDNQRMTFDMNFLVGDQVWISTEEIERYANYSRSIGGITETFSLIPYTGYSVQWPQITSENPTIKVSNGNNVVVAEMNHMHFSSIHWGL